MGRPNQGNKAQTPVGYSHGTGVSTGGLATAVLGVVARDTPGVHGVVWGLRRYGAPWECYTGLVGTSCRPRGRRRSDDVCVEGCDGDVVRWTVWRASWRRRDSLGGALTGGTRSSRWRCTGVLGVYAAVLGSVQWGSSGDAWRYWGVPLTPLTTQGARGGIPWPR